MITTIWLTLVSTETIWRNYLDLATFFGHLELFGKEYNYLALFRTILSGLNMRF